MQNYPISLDFNEVSSKKRSMLVGPGQPRSKLKSTPWGGVMFEPVVIVQVWQRLNKLCYTQNIQNIGVVVSEKNILKVFPFRDHGSQTSTISKGDLSKDHSCEVSLQLTWWYRRQCEINCGRRATSKRVYLKHHLTSQIHHQKILLILY